MTREEREYLRLIANKIATYAGVEESQWIPCSEKYPDPGERVLVTIGGCDIWVWDCKADREDDFYFWEDEQGFYHNKYEINAWMPLPKPYKKEGNQDEVD